MIHDQDTIPLSRMCDPCPTFRQFRKRYNLSIYDIATQAQVHILFVDLMTTTSVLISQWLCVSLPCSHTTQATLYTLTTCRDSPQA